MLILVTGGARSGKSGFAERLAVRAAAQGGGFAAYVATSVPFDDEMRERVELHRQRREEAGVKWHTVEEPYEAASALDRLRADAAAGTPVLLDCLTLWLTNQLLRVEELGKAEGDAALRRECDALLAVMAAYGSGGSGTLIVVTNEVGAGLVPETPLGRRFRDWAGWLNQRAAVLADEVYLTVCGIPVELKRLSAEAARSAREEGRLD
jgi:adenosylcobinamide kinase/adenosylcobinamide-phosphate guanylyltransferase